MKRLAWGIGGLGLILGMGVAQAQSLDYPSVWECDGYKPNWQNPSLVGGRGF